MYLALYVFCGRGYFNNFHSCKTQTSVVQSSTAKPCRKRTPQKPTACALGQTQQSWQTLEACCVVFSSCMEFSTLSVKCGVDERCHQYGQGWCRARHIQGHACHSGRQYNPQNIARQMGAYCDASGSTMIQMIGSGQSFPFLRVQGQKVLQYAVEVYCSTIRKWLWLGLQHQCDACL